MALQKMWVFVVVLLCSTFLLNGCEKEPTWQDHYDLGIQAMEEENDNQAITHFEDAIALDPAKPEAYAAIAEIYLAAKEQTEENLEAALEILQQGIESTGDETLIAKAEEVAIKLDELAKPQYLIEYLGMTVNELAEIWGEDYTVMDDLFLGGSKGIYYDDYRILANFYFSDPLDEGVKTGDERIHLIETTDSDWMIQDSVPSRATYSELQGLNLGGEVFESEDAEWAFEYTYEVDSSTIVRFCWDYGQDPNTTYPWVTLYREGLDVEIPEAPVREPTLKELYQNVLDIAYNQAADPSMCQYYVYDIDEDGNPELLVGTGTSAADYKIDAYTVANGSALHMGELFGIELFTTGTQICGYFAHMGYEAVTVYTMSSNSITETARYEHDAMGNYTEFSFLTGYSLTDSSGLNWTGNPSSGNNQALLNKLS